MDGLKMHDEKVENCLRACHPLYYRTIFFWNKNMSFWHLVITIHGDICPKCRIGKMGRVATAVWRKTMCTNIFYPVRGGIDSGWMMY